jgi:MFS family permease
MANTDHTNSPKKARLSLLSGDAYDVLRIPAFRLLTSARFALTFALQMQVVIVGWQVYDITKDPLSLGLIGLAEALPSLSVSLYAGHLADLHDRRKIFLSTLAVLVICSFALFYFTLDVSSVLETVGVAAIYGVIFLSGLARGFMGPSVFGLIGQIVPRGLLPKASAWNSSAWQIAAIVGPAVGGFIYAWIGITATYLLDAILVTIALYLVWLIPSHGKVEQQEGESIKERLLSGVRFVFGNQVIVGALSLDLFAVLFGGAVALLPVFAREILEVGPKGLGALRAAPAVGAAIVALALAHRPTMSHAGRKLFVAVAGFGVCIIIFGISENFYLSLFALALSGALDSISVIVRSTILQLHTPDHMRGRVSAVNSMFIGSSNEIGAFESGVAARIMGVVPSVIFGGSMTLLTVALTAWKAPKLRALELVAPENK